jgi:hypothetical protein
MNRGFVRLCETIFVIVDRLWLMVRATKPETNAPVVSNQKLASLKYLLGLRNKERK